MLIKIQKYYNKFKKKNLKNSRNLKNKIMKKSNNLKNNKKIPIIKKLKISLMTFDIISL